MKFTLDGKRFGNRFVKKNVKNGKKFSPSECGKVQASTDAIPKICCVILFDMYKSENTDCFTNGQVSTG